jgi:hypothetical protein
LSIFGRHVLLSSWELDGGGRLSWI